MIRSPGMLISLVAFLLSVGLNHAQSLPAQTADATETKASSSPAGPLAVAPKRMLILGNSITLHGPAPHIGWTGNWGMAASAEEKDFVHLLTSSIAQRTGHKPELMVDNLADFERTFTTYELDSKLKPYIAFKADLIILAIGENVAPLASDEVAASFKESVLRLLKTLKGDGQPTLVVRSCFWADKTKDEAMRQACEAVGGIYVDIGALGLEAANAARSERSFSHEGVAGHPGDRGMKAIADSLFQALAAPR